MSIITELEAIRLAYVENRFGDLRDHCVNVLKGIDADTVQAYTLTEPQLSALLIMADGYAKHAPANQRDK